MFRKILIFGAALFVTGCYDPDGAKYNVQQEQHEKSLAAIMTVYDEKCSPDSFPALTGIRDESFCDGLRESYWAILHARNIQGFEKYLEPSAR